VNLFDDEGGDHPSRAAVKTGRGPSLTALPASSRPGSCKDGQTRPRCAADQDRAEASEDLLPSKRGHSNLLHRKSDTIAGKRSRQSDEGCNDGTQEQSSGHCESDLSDRQCHAARGDTNKGILSRPKPLADSLGNATSIALQRLSEANPKQARPLFSPSNPLLFIASISIPAPPWISLLLFRAVRGSAGIGLLTPLNAGQGLSSEGSYFLSRSFQEAFSSHRPAYALQDTLD
jgi:hypothetical protein